MKILASRIFFGFFVFGTLISPVYCEDLIKEGAASGGTGVASLESAPAAASNVVVPRFTELVRALSPAVVNISVEAKNEPAEKEPGHPFLRREPNSPFRSVGSGFILSKEGFIVSNNHVIEGATKIIVRLLDDRREYEAKLIGRDVKTDVALLKIQPRSDLKTVAFGDSDGVEVGEWVIAIGNQFQLGHTVSAGIVSAKARKVHSGPSNPYDSYIQTDASINPGSSGGPLFNTKGELIGMNTAIFSPGRMVGGGAGFNIGIGFAIPSNLIRTVVPELKDKGRVTRGMLGVIVQPVSQDIADIFGLSEPEGALVSDVLDGSPASKAGFQRKDIIVSFKGQPVRDYDELPLMVAVTPIGSAADIGIIRDKRATNLRVIIDEMKESVIKEEVDQQEEKPNSIGLVVQEVTPDVAVVLKLKADRGVVVKVVTEGSAAEKGGIQRGDVIEEFNGMIIKNPEGLEDAIRKSASGKPSLVLIRRKEGSRFFAITVEKK